MPDGTHGENCSKVENNGKFYPFSSDWENGKNHLFPSRWKFGAVGAENGGSIVVIPPPRALRQAYTVSCRETKNRIRCPRQTDSDFPVLVRVVGVEPTRITSQEPKGVVTSVTDINCCMLCDHL